jgi:DNA-binding transcriptional LysR family regulator
MDLRQVQYFIAIVEKGSFTAAADYYFISQSSLSKRIIALEEELGVTLFDRSKRNVSLTQAGEAFLIHARQLSGSYQSLITDLDNYKDEKESFSIATIPVITQYGITELIADYREQNPEIQINLEELDGLNIFPALEDRRFDLAIARHNYVDPEKYDLVQISKDRLLVVVSKKSRFSDRPTLSLNELRDENFIVFDRVTDLHKLIIEECNKAGFDPTIFYSSHRKISVFGLVGTNIGVALSPSRIYEYHQNPEVIAIPLETKIECNIVLVVPKQRKIPASARGFVDFIEKLVSS